MGRACLAAGLWARPVNMELVWASLGLLGLLVLGIVVLIWVDRWRKGLKSAERASGDDLACYRDLLEQGILSQEEFEQIRLRLERGRQGEMPAQSASSSDSSSSAGPVSGNAPKGSNPTPS